MHYILKDLLAKNNLKLAVAESLTAGKLSALIASNAGISEFYQGGVTSYTCDIKNSVLGVNKDLLDTDGPYNFDTTHQMCDGVMKLMNADITVATSGVAGPGDDGNTKEGTVYISIKYKDKYYDLTYRSTCSSREAIREEASNMAYAKLENVLVDLIMSTIWFSASNPPKFTGEENRFLRRTQKNENKKQENN